MVTMDVLKLCTGCLLFTYITCLQNYWGGFRSLKNQEAVTGSDFNITKTPNLFACSLFCTVTEGCCFISYNEITFLCTRHRNWLDYRPQNSSSVWSIVREDGCSCGWHRLNTSCLLFADVSMTMSWEDSMRYCQMHDAQLVTVDTEQKDEFIREIGSRLSDFKRIWTGGSDMDNEGQWVWKNPDRSIGPYTNWKRAQPDNSDVTGGPANCLALMRMYDFQWVDNRCSSVGLPVCEKSYLAYLVN